MSPRRPRILGKTRQPAAAAASPEDRAAVERVHDRIWTMAGLSVPQPHSGLPITPHVESVGLDDHGGRAVILVRMIPGHHTEETWIKAAPRIASAWQVPRVEVRLDPDRGRVGIVRVTAICHEFERARPVAWRAAASVNEAAAMPVVDYLSALPLGEVADWTDPWIVSMCETNWTIGGIPGAGKSAFLNAILAHLALHPHIDIWHADLKGGVEAARWRNRTTRISEKQQDTVEMLRAFASTLDARERALKQAGVVNAWTEGLLGEEHPVRVLVLDECGELFAGFDRPSQRLADEATQLARSIVSRGRALGYVAIMATQKPTADTLPAAIRELTNMRIAFMCGSDSAAVAILGSGAWETIQTSAASPLNITKAQRGRCVALDDDSGEFRAYQCAWLGGCSDAQETDYPARQGWLSELAAHERDLIGRLCDRTGHYADAFRQDTTIDAAPPSMEPGDLDDDDPAGARGGPPPLKMPDLFGTQQ